MVRPLGLTDIVIVAVIILIIALLIYLLHPLIIALLVIAAGYVIYRWYRGKNIVRLGS